MQYNRDYVGSSNYDPCASDSTLSGCGGYEENKVIDNKLDYRAIGRVINNLNEGTIKIIRRFEKVGFNKDNCMKLDTNDTFKFLKKYGKNLTDISNELSRLNIGHLFYDYYEGEIKLEKITIDNIRNYSILIYYESTELKNEKFSKDVIEMSESGFYINSFSPVIKTVNHGGFGLNQWYEYVNKGYIARFSKE